MMLPPLPNPFAGQWLAHWTGLAGLVELPAQLAAGPAYGASAGLPATLALRLAGNAESVRQFVADWRAVLAALPAEGDWEAVYEAESAALAERLLAQLELGLAGWLRLMEAGLAPYPQANGLHQALSALRALGQAYLALARDTLACFGAGLRHYLSEHVLDSHETLFRLWQEAAQAAQRRALDGGLIPAYVGFFNSWQAALRAMPGLTARAGT